MEYFLVALFLFGLMLLYFKIAARYNIIDKPNHRSAHREITLRGGGIVFPLSFLFFLGHHILFKDYGFSVDNSPEQNFWIFGTGLLLVCIISFIDDLMDLSTKIRLIFHFAAVSLLLYFLNAFQILPLWAVPVAYILIIGILNAYNFMDGINGMSGLYSLVLLGSLWYVNQFLIVFTDGDFIIYPLIASLVFLFFNFRKKAKCFLGDIGSMGIAFWIIALLGLLIIESGQYKWILFLGVYGVETILTIIERLLLKENIFAAHRRHFYQLLANEKKVSHLIASSLYGIIQLFFNIIVISFNGNEWLLSSFILFPAVTLYLLAKFRIKNNVTIL